MAESHVISALIDKRAELLGLIEHHRSHIQNLSINIDQLDASILLFDPDYDFKKAKSKAIRHINPWFKQGEVPRLLIEIIKFASEPISTTQLTDNLIKLKRNWHIVEYDPRTDKNYLDRVLRPELMETY